MPSSRARCRPTFSGEAISTVTSPTPPAARDPNAMLGEGSRHLLIAQRREHTGKTPSEAILVTIRGERFQWIKHGPLQRGAELLGRDDRQRDHVIGQRVDAVRRGVIPVGQASLVPVRREEQRAAAFR